MAPWTNTTAAHNISSTTTTTTAATTTTASSLLSSRKRKRNNAGPVRFLLLPAFTTGLAAASFLSFYLLAQSPQVFLLDNHNNNDSPGVLHHLEAPRRRTGVSNLNNLKIEHDSIIQASGTHAIESPKKPQLLVSEPEQEQHWLSKADLIQQLYPNETAIANPPLSDGYSTFAACLLVMDDNMRLTEWLAYHYHVLPLRYLIVAVDPRSQAWPTHLFNQWRRRGIVIEEWQDADFWRSDLQPVPDDAEFQFKRDRHRGRQKFFYKQCLIRLKQQHRTWVSLHDSDEYLVYNHAGGDRFAAWEETRRAKHTLRQPRIQPSITPPTTAEEGAMIRYIRHEQEAGLEYYQSPCIGIPRLMFGADEAKVDPVAIRKQVPEELHELVPQFDTLKYRQHAKRNDFVKNALGKVLIDVSRVDVQRSPYFMSLHRPIKSICPTPWNNDWSSGLRINHYLGSWHSYSFRDDSRRGGERSWEQWEYKATTVDDLTDDNIRPWIGGFVQTHGAEKAREMLKDVGLPPNYRNPDDETWHLKPDKLQAILDVSETASADNKLIQFENWVREKYRNGNPYDHPKQQQQQSATDKSR